MSGEIPSALASLPDLANIFLAGSTLSGCIPAALARANNDFDELGLAYCGPRVAGLAFESVPSRAGVYRLGESIRASVVFESPVTVGGSPRLGLTIGPRVRQAAFVGIGEPGELLFRYVVQPRDRDNDGIGVGPGAPAQDAGGTIRNVDGADAVLDLGVHGFHSAPGHRVRGVEDPQSVSDRELLNVDDGMTLDLAQVLGVHCDLADCTVTLSDPDLATATIRDGVLTLVASEAAEGDLTVTLTASVQDHAVSVTFVVSLVQLHGGILRRAWLLPLIKQASADKP